MVVTYPNYDFGSASTAATVAHNIIDTAATATTLRPAIPPLALPRCCRRQSRRHYHVQRRYQHSFRYTCLPLRLRGLEPPPATAITAATPTTTAARFSDIVAAASAA